MHEHRYRTRVYYGDSDAAGVAYYARYLEFAEAGRYEYCEALGIPLALWADRGVVFAVRDVEAHYLSPARLGDEIEVLTTVTEVTHTTLTFTCMIHRLSEEGDLFRATIRAVALTPQGKVTRIPAEIRGRLKL